VPVEKVFCSIPCVERWVSEITKKLTIDDVVEIVERVMEETEDVARRAEQRKQFDASGRGFKAKAAHA